MKGNKFFDGLGDYQPHKIIRVKVKVKVTIEQVTKAQRWSRGIALLFL
jgi:hypothetical protein